MSEMNKEDFIRELAKRSNFTIEHTREIWKCVEEIFADAVLGRVILNIRGFGKLHFTKLKGRRGHDASSDKPKNFPETEQVNFKISKGLKKLLK